MLNDALPLEAPLVYCHLMVLLSGAPELYSPIQSFAVGLVMPAPFHSAAAASRGEAVVGPRGTAARAADDACRGRAFGARRRRLLGARRRPRGSRS